MRLADFIEANAEEILAEWVTFAADSGPAGKTMDLAALRDHAKQMLGIIVADLRTPQTKAEQTKKSKGQSDSGPETADTPAQEHGAERAVSGFTLAEMVSEFRALRASILRLWTKTRGTLADDDVEDMMRLNEAIDQSTAESITRFSQDLDQSKEMFIAILGHDLRSPLSAVSTASQFMLESGRLEEPNLTLATRIVRSTKRMNRLVGDLLDFTRSRLGSGIPIVRRRMDMSIAVREAVEETSGGRPDSAIQLKTSGDLMGEWDSERLSQVLVNLLTNAFEYGQAKTPIDVSLEGKHQEVVLRVHNSGAAIPTSDLGSLFDPMKRFVSGGVVAGGSNNLGLGLYIAERIVAAHGGTIEAESSAQAGTSFTVRLPR